MLPRSVCVALLSSVVSALPAHAQAPATPAPGGQDAPAAPSRHTATAKLGETELTIEHGQPAWSDERLGQMAQLAQAGQPWRMGSGTGGAEITTLEVKGAPVFFGDQLVQPGRYGMNLLATGENAWSFVVYEPLHADQSPSMLGDEPAQQVATTFESTATEIVPLMTIDLHQDGRTAACTLAWGPLRVSATFCAAQVTRSEIELNGFAARTMWYRRALPAGVDLSHPLLAGTIDFTIDEDDCSMNVYVMQEGEQIVAVLRNREREEAEKLSATLTDGLKRLDALLQQFGPQAEGQIKPLKDRAERQLIKNTITLEDTENRPDQIRFQSPAEPANGDGGMSCDLFQTRSSINLEIILGAKRAVVRLEESAFALKAQP